ncbi:MAG: DNA-directed RNA polymerase subunit beta' [Candidatus Kaelpia imicola]|nr:DNA-directed RNA polymerase subunit beta' [Candidatus Kaelpia imicola]
MYKQPDQFDYISIKIASPEVIRSWSHGEVKKPETINYRTFKPEKSGLFCERIFGPSRDFECYCGKYKRVKYKGVICDRCGVEVTHSRVRRERMGHIDLATSVVHVWFWKVLPSRIGTLLDMTIRELERVIYYEEYVVIDPGEVPLKKKELLTEAKLQELRVKYGNKFKAGMGAEAIKELIQELDLAKISKDIKKKLAGIPVEKIPKKHIKRLKVVEELKRSANDPEWMILNVLPVIPPDLRPLVPLEGGRFATSDLNDLYRRVINRNNRLKKLIELKAPEIIVRNEKRMLQESVDALFENGRHGRAVMGHGNRPLKSLSDMLKGKQGRFRQNLLGKRVDYSGRSVIVVGPELKIYECGLPKIMALELFEPFILRKLRERGHVHTIKSARKLIEKTTEEVWEILEDVIRDHPVLLNRAPTLHRLGIQAFQPKLIEGKAIQIHPLVCTPFNADFDGDQMAVHVPLSIEAQMESRLLMLASNNLFSPSHGGPLISPTQDIVLGLYYMTKSKDGELGEGKTFANMGEVIYAYNDYEISLHAKIKVRLDGDLIDTTVGRVLFNGILPPEAPYVNALLNKGKVSEIVKDVYKICGHHEAVKLLDRMKKMGFEHSTVAGISMSVADLKIPDLKEDIIKKARTQVAGVESEYKKGFITDGERNNKVIDIWTHATDSIEDETFKEMAEFNPPFMMADSGARGSRQQIRQLCGMRGLMAKPSGEIIEHPIVANFREGLSVLEYFISTHGARKGLADTALKTADAGYLTRRLVDVAQDVLVSEEDCGTVNGIFVSAIIEGDEVVVSLRERIIGRIACDNIVDIVTDSIIVKAEEIIDAVRASRIEELGIEKIKIRSVLTCETKNGICRLCYGLNLSTGKLAELGEAVGVVAAQSIGEPGTQLTMRTFHIGGTATRVIEQSQVQSRYSGFVKYHSLKFAEKGDYCIILNRNGQISINDETGRELERFALPQGSLLKFKDEAVIKKGEVFAEWDPYTSPILTEISGVVKYEDVELEHTVKEEYDEVSGHTRLVVVEYKGDYHPQVLVLNEDETEVLGFYPLPPGAIILVKDGAKVSSGDILAKTARKLVKTRDITGGLPRVAELFEARKPKNPAIVSEIDGIVEFGPFKKGQRQIIVKSETGMVKEYNIPHGKHLNVYRGDHVEAGTALTDGPLVLQDILNVCGEKKLQEYLVNEIQEVYRLQGVKINDKHIEAIIKQMIRKVKIEDPGDTSFLYGQEVDKFIFREENERVIGKKSKPAKGKLILQGITKASLTTESWVSSASFQETTRVLTDAASAGRSDSLKGLKENVIVGHLIPAGTGYKNHREIELIKNKEA